MKFKKKKVGLGKGVTLRTYTTKHPRKTDKELANYFDKRRLYGTKWHGLDKDVDHQQRLYIDDDDEEGSRYVP